MVTLLTRIPDTKDLASLAARRQPVPPQPADLATQDIARHPGANAGGDPGHPRHIGDGDGLVDPEETGLVVEGPSGDGRSDALRSRVGVEQEFGGGVEGLACPGPGQAVVDSRAVSARQAWACP
jgi:hypothetical protein